jgi:hypothetical protein
MRLDEPEHYIVSFRTELVRLFEHSIGLADPGGTAEVDSELRAPCLGKRVRELLGIATIFIVLDRTAGVTELGAGSLNAELHIFPFQSDFDGFTTRPWPESVLLGTSLPKTPLHRLLNFGTNI